MQGFVVQPLHDVLERLEDELWGIIEHLSHDDALLHELLHRLIEDACAFARPLGKDAQRGRISAQHVLDEQDFRGGAASLNEGVLDGAG